MSKIFHHDNIVILSMDERAQTRLSFELSNNDCEIRQVYNLAELEEIIGLSPIQCLVVYLDDLSPQLYDIDLYRELADMFYIVVIDAVGSPIVTEQLEGIAFVATVTETDETAVYDIDNFFIEYFGENFAA